MYTFRQLTPKRRANRDECKNYNSYHKTLREDFNKRCGYCDDLDKLRIRSFTIDHFIPQNPNGFSHTVSSNYYYNLVYSCRYCNSSKTNKWPTKDPAKHNNGLEGFVEPTTEEYTKLFQRSVVGKIIPIDPGNDLANYIIEELKLWLPIHEKMWKLEKIKSLHIQIKDKLNNIADSDLKSQLERLHYLILKELLDIQESIFVENE